MERRQLLTGVGAAVSSMMVAAEPSSLLPAVGNSFLGRKKTPEVEGKMRAPDSVLERAYDLRPKYRVGDAEYFRFTLEVTNHCVEGEPERWQRVPGYFRQEVKNLRPDGAPVFHVVRNRTRLSMFAPSPAVKFDDVPLAFGEGYTYNICFEDDFPVLPVDTSGFPSDFFGWMMLENILNSQQFFQTLTTSQHGGIDRLTHVGDRITIPDSHRSGSVVIPPNAKVQIERGESTLEFLGLGSCHGRPAAVLSFNILYHLQIPSLFGLKNGRAREPIHGLIFTALADGKILSGRLYAANLVGFPGPSGKFESSEVTVTGSLEALGGEEYVRAVGE